MTTLRLQRHEVVGIVVGALENHPADSVSFYVDLAKTMDFHKEFPKGFLI